jgi:hypothetical protein
MSTLKYGSSEATSPPLLFEKWVKKDALAEHFSISISYINKLMAKGMPRKTIGKAVLFRISEVAEWLQKRSTT